MRRQSKPEWRPAREAGIILSYRGDSFKHDLRALLWSAVVAAVLLMPGSMIETDWLAWSWRHLADSLAHGALFFVEALLVWRVARPRWRRAALATFASCLVYATLLELLQIPVPGRSFEIIDIVAAFLGILAALSLSSRGERCPDEGRRW